MDPQTLATAVLIVPAIVLGTIGWRASRAGRTSLGVGLRDGAAGEFGRGVLYSLPFLLLLVLAFGTTGLSQTGRPDGRRPPPSPSRSAASGSTSSCSSRSRSSSSEGSS